MTARPVNLLVFREGRRDVRVRDLKAHLVDQLRRSGTQASPEQTLRLLLLAGELECGVADVIACLDPQSDSLGLSSLTLVMALKRLRTLWPPLLLGAVPIFLHYQKLCNLWILSTSFPSTSFPSTSVSLLPRVLPTMLCILLLLPILWTSYPA